MLSMLDILTGRNPHPLPEVEKRDPFSPVIVKKPVEPEPVKIPHDPRIGLCPICKDNDKFVGKSGRVYAYCGDCAVELTRQHRLKKWRESLAFGPVKSKKYGNPTCKKCGERMKRYKTKLVCMKERETNYKERMAAHRERMSIVKGRVNNG